MDNSIEYSRIMTEIMYEQTRPSVLFQCALKISVDGNMYCVLLGENLVEGVAGFGETMDLAMRAFDGNFNNQKPSEGGTE